MREAFARWAKPSCNPVTLASGEGLQENVNNIGNVTHVTQEKQQPQFGAGVGFFPIVEPDHNKNRVARVTRVTCFESFDNICNPTRSARVTGLRGEPKARTVDELTKEANTWPVPTGRVFLSIMQHMEVQGIDPEPAAVAAYQATKGLMERFGGPVGLVSDLEWPGLPPDDQPEVDDTTARLVANGWRQDKAELEAPFLVARRLGIPESPARPLLNPDQAEGKVGTMSGPGLS